MDLGLFTTFSTCVFIQTRNMIFCKVDICLNHPSTSQVETDGSAPSGAPGATPDLEIQSFQDSKRVVIFSKNSPAKSETSTALFFNILLAGTFSGLHPSPKIDIE